MSSSFLSNERELLKETIKTLKQENELLRKQIKDLKTNDHDSFLEKIIESEHRFKIIIENVQNIPVQGYNHKREVIYWNKSSEEVYGYTKDEALGKKLENLIIPDHIREFVIKDVDAWIYDDIPIPSAELTLKDKFNKDVLVFSNHVMITNLKGQKEMYCIDIDLNQLKETQKELSLVKRHINSIFQAADKVSFIITTIDKQDLKILEFSPGAENIFLYKKKEVIGKSVGILHKNEDTKNFPEIIEQMEKNGKGFNGEITLIRKNQEEFPAFLSTYPLLDEKGEMSAALGVSIDISEEKKAITELEQNKAIINAVLTSIQDGVAVLDKNFNIKFVNPALKTWYKDINIFHKIKCYSCFLGAEYPCNNCPAVKAMESKKTESMVISGPPNSPIESIEVFCYPIIDEEGDDVVGVVEFMRDITKRLQLEKQLIQSQKMESIGQLAGGIAHDFNNLLTIINGYCELLLEGDFNESEKENLINIHKAGLRAERLTSQLLAFSRKQMANPIILNINQIITDHFEMISRVLGEDITIETSLTSSPGIVFMDPVQFEQIIMNLSVNARDAMPYGGTLSIKTSNYSSTNACIEGTDISPGNYVEISIIDTGEGMDDSVKNKVFEPFFTTKERNKGTGLGLSTVYGIVKQNKGYIFIDSKKNKGSRFTILLPEAKSQKVIPTITQVVEKNLKGSENILYVEDDISVRKITRSILIKNGYNVYSPDSAQEAITRFSKDFYDTDILLTDVIMPGINGKELSDVIKNKKPEIKVLYTSGYTGETITKHGLIDGEFHFIQKPYTKKDITKKIRMLLDEKN